MDSEKELHSTLEWMLRDLPNRLKVGYRKISKIDLGQIKTKKLLKIVLKNKYLGNVPEIRNKFPKLFHNDSMKWVEIPSKRMKRPKRPRKEMESPCTILDISKGFQETFRAVDKFTPQSCGYGNSAMIYFALIENSIKCLASLNLQTKDFCILGHFRHFNENCSLGFLDDKIICLSQVLNPKGKNPYGVFKSFDLKTLKKNWQGVGPNMDPRRHYKTAIVGKHIYVLGGDCDLVERINLGPLLDKKEAWGEPEPTIRRGSLRGRGFGVGVILDRIYVLGGQVEDEDGSSYVRSDVAFLDTTKLQWTGVRPMQNSRMDFAVAVDGCKIYVLGGITCYDDKRIILNSVEMYNLCEGVWKTISPMKRPRANFSAFVNDGYLFAIGGDNLTSGDPVPTAERCNLKTTIWEEWGRLRSQGFYQHAVAGVGVGTS